MFDVPVDATYVWFGVATVSLASFGVAVGLPSAAPPDAAAAASTVDAVAVAPPGAVATHDLETAERLRLGSARLSLDGPGGRTHATFLYPVTPANTDDRLKSVSSGAPPPSRFDSPASFERATRDARGDDRAWRPAPTRLTVRRVAWGDVNVTLVG